MVEADLIIEAGKIVTSVEGAVIERGAIAVKDGEIIFVGPQSECRSSYQAPKVVKRPNGLVIPGLINTHTHAPMVLFRGMADDLPLKRWLEEYIFPAETGLTPELVALGAELACAEMIRSGTTAFVDMYLFEATIAEVVDRVGIRAWLGEGVFDFASPAFPSGREALIETRRLWEEWRGHPRITITVDPHTPYTACEELIRESFRLARELDTLLVTHVAETRWEIEEMKRRHGMGPVEYLDGMGILDSSVLAAHCVWLDQKDMSIFAAKVYLLPTVPSPT